MAALARLDGAGASVTRTRTAKFSALALAGLAAALPGAAQANSAAVDYFRNRADRSAVPTLLSAEDRAYYSELFAAIDRGDWTRVQALFTQRPEGPLHQ